MHLEHVVGRDQCGGRRRRFTEVVGKLSHDVGKIGRDRLPIVQLDSDDGDRMAAAAHAVKVNEVEPVPLCEEIHAAVAIAPTARGTGERCELGAEPVRTFHLREESSQCGDAVTSVSARRDYEAMTFSAFILLPSMSVQKPTETTDRGYSKDRTQLLRRLSRIEGQARGIARMVERDEYCLDILQQTAALRAAVDAVSLLLMEDHVAGCLATAVKTGNAETYTEEVMEVVRRSMGRPVRGRAAE